MKTYTVQIECDNVTDLREALFKAAYEVKADPQHFDEMEVDEDYTVNNQCIITRMD